MRYDEDGIYSLKPWTLFGLVAVVAILAIVIIFIG
jgi:hypothetical protein